MQLTKLQHMEEKETPLRFLKFLLLSYILTAILLLVLAFLLYRFQIGGKAVALGVILIYLLSTFLGGFLAGKKAKSRKYLWGLALGGAYFLILAAISLLTGCADGGVGFLTALLLCLGGGMLGGMVS